MSTPVSVDAPPIALLRTDSEQERDLSNRLQRMITLQYQEQQLETIENNDATTTTTIASGSSSDGNTMMHAKRSTTELMGLNVLDAAEDEQNQGTGEDITKMTSYNSTSKPPPAPAAATAPGIPQSPRSTSSIASGVGRGTMYFSSNYQGSRGGNYGGGISSGIPMSSSKNNNSNFSNLNQPILNHPPQQIYAGGAGGGGYGSVEQQQQRQHDFHYGNPDYHDPYDNHMGDGDYSISASSRKSFCERCCCLYRPLVNLLSQEHVHRSFCYGAIDGMLTGSGIVSAFRALNVLSIHTRWEIRLAVVVFSAAACIADSLCMAIGHIWTSYVMSMGHAQDKARERKLLNSSRADAKAKLVDALLSKGMLKIDAMSLADTLEGYPDLFVGTLVGDSLLAAGDDMMMDNDTDDSHTSTTGTRNFGLKIPSYGSQLGGEQIIDTTNVTMVVKESQKEGFFMMLGFAMFAIVPGLLWLFLPEWMHPSNSATKSEGQTISLVSIILTISAVVMWCLGVWKSTFLDSNWALFGIETVIVLFVCVFSSYGCGMILFYMLGDSSDGLVLTNVPPTTTTITEL